jgi:hypothetical protein
VPDLVQAMKSRKVLEATPSEIAEPDRGSVQCQLCFQVMIAPWLLTRHSEFPFASRGHLRGIYHAQSIGQGLNRRFIAKYHQSKSLMWTYFKSLSGVKFAREDKPSQGSYFLSAVKQGIHGRWLQFRCYEWNNINEYLVGL